MPHVNVENVSKFYDAYLERDLDGVAALVHPDVEWHTIAGPLVGVEVVHGRSELVAFLFDQIPETIPDFAARIQELTELDDEQILVVNEYKGHGAGGGAAVEMETVAIYRVRDGLIVSHNEFSTRAEAVRCAGESVADASHPASDSA